MPEDKVQGITRITVSGSKSLRDESSIEVRPLTILAGANSSGKSSIMQPLLLMKQTLESSYDPGALRLDGSNVEFTIQKMQPNREDPSLSKVEIAITDPNAVSRRPKAETLIVEASVKPYINLVWAGTITLIVGFILTIVRRVQEASGNTQ